MDENENKDVDLQKNEPVEDTTEEVKPEKPVETPEQKKARLERQLKRVKRELGEVDDEPAPKAEKPKSSDLDYGQKAFLKSYGISGSDELALAKNWLHRTGDDLDSMVEDDIFKSKLEALRKSRATQEATPTATKRSNTPTMKDVDYWLTKNELPPNTPENQQLRRDVVNARQKRETEGSKFTTMPVVGKF